MVFSDDSISGGLVEMAKLDAKGSYTEAKISNIYLLMAQYLEGIPEVKFSSFGPY